MIEIGRRGFITGLFALVAAPALVRVESIMPISVRHVPLYVPVNWLTDEVLIGGAATLTAHAWPRPLGATWVNIRDFDPSFVRDWVKRLDLEQEEYWLS